MSNIDRKYIALGLAGLTAVAAFAIYHYNRPTSNKMSSADAEEKNVAYVFIKPHANSAKSQELVSNTLLSKGIKIVQEGEFTGEQIDAGRKSRVKAEIRTQKQRLLNLHQPAGLL